MLNKLYQPKFCELSPFPGFQTLAAFHHTANAPTRRVPQPRNAPQPRASRSPTRRGAVPPAAVPQSTADPRPAAPEAREGTEQRSRGHAHGEAHHEAHLHSVEAAGLRLPVRAHGHGHLQRSAQRSAPCSALRTAASASASGTDGRGGAAPRRFCPAVRASVSPSPPPPCSCGGACRPCGRLSPPRGGSRWRRRERRPRRAERVRPGRLRGAGAAPEGSRRAAHPPRGSPASLSPQGRAATETELCGRCTWTCRPPPRWCVPGSPPARPARPPPAERR